MAKFRFSDTDFKKCTVMAWNGDTKCCRACNRKLVGRQRRWCSRACFYVPGKNHSWGDARKAALARDLFQCTKCGSTKRLEVNHKNPILGRHAENGCHHHLDGLETLCHACHLKITAEQRAAGLFRRTK